jgi:hypothetical protein
VDGDYYKRYNNFSLTSCQHRYLTEKIPKKSRTQDEKVVYYTSHILAEETVKKESNDLMNNVQRKYDICKISETAKEWGGAYGFSITSISM